jgi:diguanylate cyclase (GGDEF)-like protein
VDRNASGKATAGKPGFLKSIAIFQDLEDGEIGNILGVLHPRHLDEGEVLFREGSPGGELFVVESGSMGTSVTLADGKALEIASFSSGDFFGEMSIFEEEPRSATCYAKSDCRLLALNDREFFKLIESNPASAAKMMRRMLLVTRHRLQDTGEFLSDMVQWGEEARKRAVTDPLTGLYNRRYLEEALEEHFMKAREAGRPLAIVMLDLDHFRRINESYSEKLGDRVIAAAAEVFRRHLRQTDVAARYGGDEFTFILPETDGETARRLMETIREDVERLDLLEKKPGPVRRVTTSQGVACYPAHANSSKSLREAADAALYKAKELGRNRVILSSD